MGGRGLKRTRQGEGYENEEKADVDEEHKSHKRLRSNQSLHELSSFPYSFNIDNDHPKLPFPTSHERSTIFQLPLFYSLRRAYGYSNPIWEVPNHTDSSSPSECLSHRSPETTPTMPSASPSPPVRGLRRSRVQLRRSSSSEGSARRNPYVLDVEDEEDDSGDEVMDRYSPDPNSSSSQCRNSQSSFGLPTLGNLAIRESADLASSSSRNRLRLSVSSTTSQMILTPTFTVYGGPSNAFRDLAISTSPDILSSQSSSTTTQSHGKMPEGDDKDAEMQDKWKDAIVISDDSRQEELNDINMRDQEEDATTIQKRVNKKKDMRRDGERRKSTRLTSNPFKSSGPGSTSFKTRQVDEANKKNWKEMSLRRSGRHRGKEEESE